MQGPVHFSILVRPPPQIDEAGRHGAHQARAQRMALNSFRPQSVTVNRRHTVQCAFQIGAHVFDQMYDAKPPFKLRGDCLKGVERLGGVNDDCVLAQHRFQNRIKDAGSAPPMKVASVHRLQRRLASIPGILRWAWPQLQARPSNPLETRQ